MDPFKLVGWQDHAPSRGDAAGFAAQDERLSPQHAVVPRARTNTATAALRWPPLRDPFHAATGRRCTRRPDALRTNFS